MKKIFIALLLVTSYANAQEESAISSKKNEFRIDVLSAVLSSKASISYERFLENDFSVGININYSDSKKLRETVKKKSTFAFRLHSHVVLKQHPIF